MTPSPAPAAPAPRKTPVWVWILAGIAGFFVLMLGLVFVAGLVLVNKTLDLLDNPKELAAVVHRLNPDLDVLDVDKEKRTIRVRDKQKDETFAVSLDDLKNGRIHLERQRKDGAVESIDLGGKVDLPNWVPGYPGSAPQMIGQVRSDEHGEGGLVEFSSYDLPEKVRAFYREAAPKRGLDLAKEQDNPRHDHYVSEDGILHLVIDAQPAGRGSRVRIIFGQQKK